MKKVLGLISEKHKDASTCESCGDEFTCGATLKGCWCMDINLNDQDREKLKAKYDKCLCRNCLEQVRSSEHLLR